jgi:hypothetical protein
MTCYGLESLEIEVVRFFPYPLHPDQFWGPTHLFIQWLSGALSLELKQLRCDDHTPLTTAEVKNMWTHTFTPLHLHSTVLKWLSRERTQMKDEMY